MLFYVSFLNPDSMSEKIYLYPQWIRVWHGLNALLCLTLIFTGLSMQYSNPDYTLIIRFDVAVNVHNISGILLSLSYFFFVIGNLIRPNGRHYRIALKGFIMDLFKQFRHYAFGVFKGEEAPFPITEKSKFNPLQKFTYIILMYFLVPVVVISGWVLIFPDFMQNYILGEGSIYVFDFLHLITGFVISLFMVIHVYFCTMGKTAFSNFKSIINGWHEAH